MKTLYTGSDEALQELLVRVNFFRDNEPKYKDKFKSISKFEEMLHAASNLSKDPVKGVGSLLLSPGRHKVMALGYNGLPYGMPDAAKLLDPEVKNGLMIHSELNLVANAAELGVRTSGGILLCSKASCHICAGVAVTAGISEVYTYRSNPFSDWHHSIMLGNAIFKKAGVPVIYFD